MLKGQKPDTGRDWSKVAKAKVVEGAFCVELEDPDRSVSSLLQLALAALDTKVNEGNWLPEPPVESTN